MILFSKKSDRNIFYNQKKKLYKPQTEQILYPLEGEEEETSMPGLVDVS